MVKSENDCLCFQGTELRDWTKASVTQGPQSTLHKDAMQGQHFSKRPENALKEFNTIPALMVENEAQLRLNNNAKAVVLFTRLPSYLILRV